MIAWRQILLILFIVDARILPVDDHSPSNLQA